MGGRASQTAPGASLTVVPQHVAFIMDGNGRWARQRGLPRIAGHRAGVENLRRIIRAAGDLGIKIVTLYAFSTENWSRPRDEVNALMSLLDEYIERELDELRKNGAQLRHLGSLKELAPGLQAKIQKAIQATAGNHRLVVCVALNYGSRSEIVEAVRGLMRTGLSVDQVTEQSLARHLYTADLPDPDLIIRTAGEMRLSNFMLWQAAYAEFYATPTLWPDFGPDELRQALVVYGQRLRKFGGLQAEGTPAPA